MTPLHRGFSLFLFDREGRLLLQRRSGSKTTWPLVWSNSVCGHPTLGESRLQAGVRRLADELGMAVAHIEEVAPYRYTFTLDGVMENEVCPIFVGFTAEMPKPNPAEVAAVRWALWSEFLHEIKEHPGTYTPWCEEEARILAAHPGFQKLYAEREKYFRA